MPKSRHRYEPVPGAFKAVREAAFLTQDDAARLIGVSTSHVQLIDQGRVSFPGVDVFMDLCEVYGVEPRAMFERCYRRVGADA